VKRSYSCTNKVFEDEAKEWFRQGTQKFARLKKKSMPIRVDDPSINDNVNV